MSQDFLGCDEDYMTKMDMVNRNLKRKAKMVYLDEDEEYVYQNRIFIPDTNASSILND